MMQLGKPVTWANPDVVISLAGIKQDTYDLIVNTTYDVAITVHNTSQEKEARGTHVDVRWIEFGAGGQIRHHVGHVVIDVPVWPGVTVTHMNWLTPPTPGHFCLEIELFHPKDGNPANNLGWNNTQVKTAHSPVTTSVRIFNRYLNGAPSRQENVSAAHRGGIPWNLVEITVDSYTFADSYGIHANPDLMFEARPPVWNARVEPSLFHFQLTETYRDVELLIDAPSGVGPAENFNVTARQGGAPLGGVTVTVNRGT
ncbi:MAG TPA: hypothetical protein VGQ12_17535 [Candidatus Angelobacter sp.]|nr:hypothetical protein [Candidatus Angelobacter sp.]